LPVPVRAADPAALLVEHDPADAATAVLEPQLDLVELAPAARVRPAQLEACRPAGAGAQRGGREARLPHDELERAGDGAPLAAEDPAPPKSP
jgi:hypothetical protein